MATHQHRRRRNQSLLIGHRLPLPGDAQSVRFATADGNGAGLDCVYLKPGAGEYVQATGVEPDSHATGQLFYVSDTGLRYHISDGPRRSAGCRRRAEARGQTVPQPAPWPVLSLLPPGPELSQQAAMIAHDGMPPIRTGRRSHRRRADIRSAVHGRTRTADDPEAQWEHQCDGDVLDDFDPAAHHRRELQARAQQAARARWPSRHER